MVGHGGSSAGSYLADPTSPIPSHCASLVATSTLRVTPLELIRSVDVYSYLFICQYSRKLYVRILISHMSEFSCQMAAFSSVMGQYSHRLYPSILTGCTPVFSQVVPQYSYRLYPSILTGYTSVFSQPVCNFFQRLYVTILTGCMSVF